MRGRLVGAGRAGVLAADRRPVPGHRRGPDLLGRLARCRPTGCRPCWPARPSRSWSAATGRSRWPATSRARARRSPRSTTAAPARRELRLGPAGRHPGLLPGPPVPDERGGPVRPDRPRHRRASPARPPLSWPPRDPPPATDRAGRPGHRRRARPAAGPVPLPGGPAGRRAAAALRPGLRGPRRRTTAAELPPIAARGGLDLHPVDVRDPAARRWLQACAPPEAAALARLAAAIAVTRRIRCRCSRVTWSTRCPACWTASRPASGWSWWTPIWPCSCPPGGGPGWPPCSPTRAGPGRSPGCRSTRWYRSGLPGGAACRVSRCPAGWSATTSAPACSPCSARAPSIAAPSRELLARAHPSGPVAGTGSAPG